MNHMIGMMGPGVVIFGDGLPHGMMTDENGVMRQAEPVIWDKREGTPEFNVIGYAGDQHQALEVAHQFADFNGLPFVDFDHPV